MAFPAVVCSHPHGCCEWATSRILMISVDTEPLTSQITPSYTIRKQTRARPPLLSAAAHGRAWLKGILSRLLVNTWPRVTMKTRELKPWISPTTFPPLHQHDPLFHGLDKESGGRKRQKHVASVKIFSRIRRRCSLPKARYGAAALSGRAAMAHQ